MLISKSEGKIMKDYIKKGTYPTWHVLQKCPIFNVGKEDCNNA